MSLPAIHNSFGAAVGTVLALIVIPTALLAASLNRALSGHVIAVAAGVVIGVIALAVAIAVAATWRLRLPSNNDAWVFW